MAETSHMDNIL